MKNVLLSLIDHNLMIRPGDDNPTFLVYLNEIPHVGDYLFFGECEKFADDDESDLVSPFCDSCFPQERSGGTRLKVVERTIIRDEGEPLIVLDVIRIPGFLKRIKSVKP